MQLETDRLILRPLQASDVDDLLPYHSDPESVRYIPWEVRDREAVTEWLTKAITFNTFLPAGIGLIFAIVEKSSGRVIGQLNTKVVDEPNNTANIGYILNPDSRGKGFVNEGMQAVLNYLFYAEKVHRVVADIDVRNLDSVRVVERLGFRREATHIENDFLKGEWCSMYLYALLSREWPAN